MANSISSIIVPIDDSRSTVRDLKPVGPILNLPTVRVLRAAQSRLRQRLFVFMMPGESAIPTSNAPFLPWKALVKGDVFLPVTVSLLIKFSMYVYQQAPQPKHDEVEEDADDDEKPNSPKDNTEKTRRERGKHVNAYSAPNLEGILVLVFGIRMVKMMQTLELLLEEEVVRLEEQVVHFRQVDTDRTVKAFYKFLKQHAAIPFKLQKPESTQKPEPESTQKPKPTPESSNQDLKQQVSWLWGFSLEGIEGCNRTNYWTKPLTENVWSIQHYTDT
ncbi:hypothetical protein LXL04_004175 [Taraxacum kok-saghyz]